MADDDHENCIDSLEYWLHSLNAKVPESNIILVGTHYDMINQKEEKIVPIDIILSKFNQVSYICLFLNYFLSPTFFIYIFLFISYFFCKQIQKSFSVSCTTGFGIDNLRKYLIELVIAKPN